MRVRRLFQPYLFELACAALLGASAHAAAPVVHKVSSLPALTPLTMATGGRIFAFPTAMPNGFGATDFTYQWPGIYFRAAFEGNSVFFRVVKGDQILHIGVDGQPATLLFKPEAAVYAIDGLSGGKHEISILVATESQAGPNTFGGFAVPSGGKALAPPRRRRQMEFIGDSHTVGYGDISATRTCTEDEVWANTDDTQAFGAITAEHYDADYQINAISGRGVVRNYGGFQADALPQAYRYVLFDKQQEYSDLSWKPRVLVIALGTNDFTTPLHAGEPWKTRDELHADYEATYLKFLEVLRTRDPGALIIVWATDMAEGEIEVEAQKVVDAMKKRGDQHITFLPINGLGFSACNWHPGLVDEKVIADKLERLIDADQHVWK